MAVQYSAVHHFAPAKRPEDVAERVISDGPAGPESQGDNVLDVRGERVKSTRSRSRIESMAAKADTVKTKARELIEHMPDNATWDDVAYEIAVRRSIERGLADLEADHIYTSEALLESLGLAE
jgi:hypothetical protein